MSSIVSPGAGWIFSPLLIEISAGRRRVNEVIDGINGNRGNALAGDLCIVNINSAATEGESTVGD